MNRSRRNGFACGALRRSPAGDTIGGDLTTRTVPVPRPRTTMSTASVADLVDLLRKSRLLDAARLDKVIKGQGRFPDALTLAKELVRRGWLTREQAQELLRGRAPQPAVELEPTTNGAEEAPP